jgi:hypothetical protein
MHGDGRHAVARPLDRLDQFLAQVLAHERIADLHELRRGEADLLVALQQHRVLGREAQATVDRACRVSRCRRCR